jgi:hypothetical protein
MSSEDSSRPIFRDVIDSNSRDTRQNLIREIQKELKSKLITYIANPNHLVPNIMVQDTVLFEDLLRSVSGEKKCYLMLNSPGGDPNAAEKLLTMCRNRFEEFIVIVPNYAKSAATMICLGSDKILMGYMAELGPIDPQLQIEPGGIGRSLPARSFIDGLENIRKKIKEEGDPPTMYLSMLQQISPEIIAICQSATDDSRQFAEKWLSRFMFKNNTQQAKLVADWLSNGETYKSHGKVIDYEEAKNTLKLNVEMIDPNSSLWNKIWELYVRQVHFFDQNKNGAKLFESESVSLNMNIQVTLAQTQMGKN